MGRVVAVDTRNAATEVPQLTSLMDQYGIQLKTVAEKGRSTATHVLGPPEAVNDASNILRLRFVQGKAVATVLTLPGQLQNIPAAMKADYEGDVQALQQELGVQVQAGNVAALIIGTGEDAVGKAK